MKTISKECLNCNKAFEAPIREHRRGNAKYCSISCGAGRPRVQHVPNRECAVCSKPIYRKPSSRPKSGFHFCGLECKSIAHSKGSGAKFDSMIPEHFKVHADKRCLNCDTIVLDRRKKYCSTSCSAEGRSYTTTIAPAVRFFSGQMQDRKGLKRMLTHMRGYTCEVCQISEWKGKPLSLQLDHIDGNAGNDYPDNLRLICPNCHSQTDTYCAKNKGSGRGARGLKR